MPGNEVVNLDAELETVEKTCPLFNDAQMDFCKVCKIEPIDGFMDNSTFDMLSGSCIMTIDLALEELENAEVTPEAIVNRSTAIIAKLDKIINNRFRLSDLNKQTIDTVLFRFSNLEKKFGPKRSKLCVEIGNLYFGMKYYKKAIEWYDLASKVNPENKDAWNNKGVTMVRLGKVESSLQFYDLALKIAPNYEQAWFNKGKALYKLRRIRESLACFDKVVQVNPESVIGWNNRGVLLRLLDKKKEAIASYDNAIRLRADYEWAWHNKGMVYAESGKVKEALECFDNALDVNANFKPSIDAKMTFGKKGMLDKYLSRKQKETEPDYNEHQLDESTET